MRSAHVVRKECEGTKYDEMSGNYTIFTVFVWKSTQPCTIFTHTRVYCQRGGYSQGGSRGGFLVGFLRVLSYTSCIILSFMLRKVLIDAQMRQEVPPGWCPKKPEIFTALLMHEGPIIFSKIIGAKNTNFRCCVEKLACHFSCVCHVATRPITDRQPLMKFTR